VLFFGGIQAILAQDFMEEGLGSLKAKNFEKTKVIISRIENDSLAKNFNKLLKIIEEGVHDLDNTIINANNNPEYQILNFLAEGHTALLNIDGNLIEAYTNFSEALRLAEESNLVEAKKFAIVSLLDMLNSEIYIGSKQYLFYLNYFKTLASDKTDDLLYVLYSLSLSSKLDENFKVSKDFNQKLFVLDSTFNNVANSNPFKARYYFDTAIQYKIKGDFKAAIKSLRKSSSLCTGIRYHKDLKRKIQWQLSSTYYLANQIDSARYYLKEAKKQTTTIRDEFYNERLQSWIYKEEGLFDSAYVHLNNSVNLEYRLGAKNNGLESAILAVQNETDKLKLDKLALDVRRKRNQTYLIFALAALFLGTGIAILIQNNTTKKRLLAEQEALLKQERVDNLLKEQELVSIDAMIAGQEKERQRVANELHDDLGSLMATIKLHFDNSKVSKKDPALKNAQKLLEEAYQKVRGIAHSKNSGVMSDQGLLPAIKKMAQVITETNALEVVVEDFGMGDRLENSLELNLFRMVQELVANTIKHAEASKVSIQLTQHEDNLNIIIEDNGKGFDRSKIETGKTGMGLTTIEKRVEHLEGSFTVDSILGKGTSILIDIPV
jgi:signal transduction histidine kinase